MTHDELAQCFRETRSHLHAVEIRSEEMPNDHLFLQKRLEADLRRIERTNRQRRQEAPRVTRIERQAESDDEVRSKIPPELVALFER